MVKRRDGDCYLEHAKVNGQLLLWLITFGNGTPMRVTTGRTTFPLLCYKRNKRNLYVWFNIPGDKFIWYGKQHELSKSVLVQCMRTKQTDARKLKTKGATWLGKDGSAEHQITEDARAEWVTYPTNPNKET